MKTALIVSISIFLAIFTLQGQNFQDSIPASYGYKVALGETVPNFTLTFQDGSKMDIAALRGKVVMLQFTASWCSVCRKEMPHIEKNIWLKHKDNPDFALYGIDLQEKADKVAQFQEDIKTTYPITLDLEGDIFNTFVEKNGGVTRNIIIDKDGKIVFMTRLFKQAEFDQMCDVIDDLLEE